MALRPVMGIVFDNAPGGMVWKGIEQGAYSADRAIMAAKKTTTTKNTAGGDAVGRRREAVRVKASKRRTESSRRWLQRHLNDPYVAASKEDGYRSRAAYKIIQLDEKFQLLHPGMRVVDLGAAPGGWSQIVSRKIGAKGKLVAIDILPMDPLPGVDIMQLDFLQEDAPDKLKAVLAGSADLVLSDMAHSTTGHTGTDQIRVMALAETAAHFAVEILSPGGVFVCKYFQGGAEKTLLDLLRKHFSKIRHAKPAASRAESSETYLVAQGFRP